MAAARFLLYQIPLDRMMVATELTLAGLLGVMKFLGKKIQEIQHFFWKCIYI